MVNRKQLGKHDYKRCKWDGEDERTPICKTFSVGVFEWVKAKDPLLGLKPGTAKVRVTGSTSNPEAVYRRCELICNALDAGLKVTKNVRVKPCQ